MRDSTYFDGAGSAIWYLAGSSDRRKPMSVEAMSDRVAAALNRAARGAVRKSRADVEADVRQALAGAVARELGVSREGYGERTFEFRSAGGGDGRELTGYAAVFNTAARIRDHEGEFEETIAAGAFRDSLAARMPVLQYDHGRDARVGGAPIGAIEELREDTKGLFVRARLFANPVVEPIRQAIEAQAIRGMSFRFEVPEDGDRWSKRDGMVTREIRRADIHELGPVTFPAYSSTSVSVRRR